MGLSWYKVGAGLAVSDMNRAREFYEAKLGLSVSIDSGDNVQYRCAEGTVMHVYLSPEHAGKSTATLVGWDVGGSAAYLAVALLGLVVLGITGFLGGNLSTEWGIGVRGITR